MSTRSKTKTPIAYIILNTFTKIIKQLNICYAQAMCTREKKQETAATSFPLT